MGLKYFIAIALLVHVSSFCNRELSITKIHNLIFNEHPRYSCKSLIKYFLQKAHESKHLNCVINLSQNAVAEAIKLDEYFETNNKKIGLLHCVPILVKDNIAVRDVPNTFGIEALRYSIPKTDAYIVKKLRDEGAIILGKTNLAEMGFSSYDSEIGGKCSNVWDLKRSCGRFSPGSACGIVAGLSVLSIGTSDTAASASYNDIFGLSTPLLNNFDGIFSLMESDDSVGLFGNYLDDLILAHSVIIDSVTDDNWKYLEKEINKQRTAIRIGYIKHFLSSFIVDIGEDGPFNYEPDLEIIQKFYETVENFKKIRIEVVQLNVSEKSFDEMIIDLKDISFARYFGCGVKCLKSSLDKYFGNKDRFQNNSYSDDLKNSSLLSPFLKGLINNSNVNSNTCSYSCLIYQNIKKKIKNRFESWFNTSSIDLLIFPTTIKMAPYINETSSKHFFGPSFIPEYSGYASLNIPAFFSIDKLPIGVMLIARDQNFNKLIKSAKLYEENYLRGAKMLPKSGIFKSENKPCQKNFAQNKSKVTSLKLYSVIYIIYRYWFL